MGTISIRWVREDKIKIYEKQEAKGTISAGRLRVLQYWRKAKEKYPNLVSIAESGGRLYVSDAGE